MAISNELKDAVIRLQQGDESAFSAVYDGTYRYVYEKARYIMKDEQDALDLVQETYVQAYKGIRNIDDVNNIYAWLGGIAYRQGMKIFNKKKEILIDEDQEFIFEDLQSNESTPAELAEEKATANIVMGMIDELPSSQRVAVLAFYYDNMKIDEIAVACECSANTIKSRLNYAKKTLKEKIEIHEKTYKYKLCSLSPTVLLYAFKALFSEESYQIPKNIADSVYQSIKSVLNISGTVSGTMGVNAAISTTKDVATGTANVATTATAMGTAGTAATTTAATTTGIALTAKIGIVAASVIIAGGIGTALALNAISDDSEPEETQIIETTENISEISDETENDNEVKEIFVFNGICPIEGEYVLGNYRIVIQNSTYVTRNNFSFVESCDIFIDELDENGKLNDRVEVNSAGITGNKTEFTAISRNGDEWNTKIRFCEDDFIVLDANIKTSDGDVYSFCSEVADNNIFTKLASEYKNVPNKNLSEGNYIYQLDSSQMEEDPDPNDFYEDGSIYETGGINVEISDVNNNSEKTEFKMSIEIISFGSYRVDILDVDVDTSKMMNNIATFSGYSGWGQYIQGYFSITDDGNMMMSYCVTEYSDDIRWYGSYPEKGNRIILLKE